jgi:tyrosine-protein kinase Etk/Wzc
MHRATRPTPLAVLVRHARSLVLVAAGTAALVYGATFLIPNEYTAATVMLPPSGESDLGGLFGSIPGGAALSLAFGLDAASATSRYLGVLRSETVRSRLVDRFDLMRVYKQKDVERARKKLKSKTAITLTNDGFVRLSVTDRDRQRAASIANAYVEELDRFLMTNANRSAGRRREFLETRLEGTRRDLARAEDALRDFQVRNRMPGLAVASERAADAAADLMAQKYQREIQLGTLESVTLGASPSIDELRNEIRQIDSELVKIPPAATAMARLYRDVKIQEKIVLVLTEEFERARILEIKDVPSVEVVDVATPPIQKSGPRRTLMAVAAFAAALVAVAALTWVREASGREGMLDAA